MPYKSHFGLKESPFSPHPNPRYFYLTDQHKTAMDKGSYVADNKLGLGITYGSPGTGKTSTARILHQKYSDDDAYKTILIEEPDFKTDNRMLRAIIHEFDVGETQKAMQDSMAIFERYLKHQVYEEGKTCLMIVDHAEQMKEELYALINDLLEMRGKKDDGLLNVLMFGRHDMRDKLVDPRSKDIHRKIAVTSSLEPLTFDDMAAKVEFRFHIAGLHEHPFTEDALKELYVKSKGVPRAVNRLADKALYEALMENSRQITREHVLKAEKILGLDHERLILKDGEEPRQRKTGKRGRPPVKPKRP